mmetsp:Transcript_32494/g.66432  ORF Transcript_32494/g.66432 Transcript_32494/m.66432 type:complete len:90 (+) Transcript_32494:914-1183(+)
MDSADVGGKFSGAWPAVLLVRACDQLSIVPVSTVPEPSDALVPPLVGRLPPDLFVERIAGFLLSLGSLAKQKLSERPQQAVVFGALNLG